MSDATEDYMDENDQSWVNSFSSIPDGAVVEGFVSIISFINPDGTLGHRVYHCLNKPLSHMIGLLEMAKYEYMHENLTDIE